MKRFVSKPSATYSEQWDGSADADLITRLHEAGWVTHIQLPIEGQKVNAFDEAEQKWVPAPAKARMVIVGTYRKQVAHVEAGQYLSWGSGDTLFHAQDSEPDGRHWTEDAGDVELKLPTPDDFKNTMDLDEMSW